MKKLLFIPLLMISITFVEAQTKVAVTVGAVLANIVAKGGGLTVHAKSKAGITAGLSLDMPLRGKLWLQSGLNWVQKGYVFKDKDSYFGITSKETISFQTIELPFTFTYKTDGKARQFFMGAGPSIAFSFSGKVKYQDSEGNTEKTKIKFGSSDEDDFKGTDISLNLLAGAYISKNLYAAIHYNAGFTNLSNSEDEKAHTHYWGLRIGYVFPAAKK
jgi:hypothetical protein